MLCVCFVILVVPRGIMGNSVVGSMSVLGSLMVVFHQQCIQTKLNNIHNGSLITINISDSLIGTSSTWRKFPHWARLVNPITMSWLESCISQNSSEPTTFFYSNVISFLELILQHCLQSPRAYRYISICMKWLHDAIR